ncbi:MAG: deoxynucleoside kinase [Gammaproteobacteria bacterium]|nr:deoxynucleoside kinase [Gammaproteobacteria bacterium]
MSDGTGFRGYLVIEGPIGTGKTSLARRLAQAFGADLTLEDPDENPFLERFYESRQQYALPTQLFFLFQRARQLARLKQTNLFHASHVSDFMLEKDPLFARLNLDADELRLYQQVYDKLALEVPTPDLVVYLQAPVEVTIERVRRRGTPYEQVIDRGYLEELTDAYMRFFHNYNDAPLLIINAAEINFVENDSDLATLIEQIGRIRSGRHFFNPLSEPSFQHS